MFSYIYKKLSFWKMLNQNSNNENNKKKKNPSLSNNLKANLTTIRSIFGKSNDIVIREFIFGNKKKINAAIIFVVGMTSKAIINENIIRPLMYDSHLFDDENLSSANDIDTIKKTMISVGDVSKTSSLDEIINSCLSGDTIFLIDGSREALLISAKGWETRGVDEPKTESVVRGPREGFSETLRTNTTLLRRKIKDPALTFEPMKIGERTKTDICIAYVDGIVNPQLVEEIRRRLNRIRTDSILESGYIEQFIEDAPFSIFSTVGNSEKPDIVAAKLLEGRAAIMVDGTPFVLTVPMLFIEGFQSAEDYYSRPYFASFVRLLRFLSFTITILAPATYVILTSFHQELLPTSLLLTMAASHEGVPFPSVLEAGIMMMTFEILREAGIRLPRPVGQAISIVGALVIGESAVSAGLIGAPMVIVVAITAVSGFVVPAQTDSAAILRIILLILAGFMGGYGVGIGLLCIIINLASLRSFGTPYLSPLAPPSISGLKDSLIRVPLWKMLLRPKGIGKYDPQRQGFRLKPHHPKNNSQN